MSEPEIIDGLEMYKPLPDDCTMVTHPGEDGVAVHKRYVAAVANRLEDGTIFLGVRHFCPLMRQNIDNWIKANGIEGNPRPRMEQGFVDQHGTFMDREEAMTVAVARGQIMRSVVGYGAALFSEHLH